MTHATAGTLGRLATLVSGIAIIGIAGCSDGGSTAPTRTPVGTSISADRGGHGGGGQQNDHGDGDGRDNHNQNHNDNSGPGNNNQNNNQNNQNNNQNNNNQNQERVRLEMQLTPPATGAAFPGAEGHARFEMRSDRTELSIEVEHVAGGTAVVFLVNGAQVGMEMVTGTGSNGETELELSTRNGNTLPAVQAGSTVTVQTADGKVIVSGTF